MWLLAVVCGLVVGKTLIHGLLLSRFLRLKMFRADQVGEKNDLRFPTLCLPYKVEFFPPRP